MYATENLRQAIKKVIHAESYDNSWNITEACDGLIAAIDDYIDEKIKKLNI